MNLDFQPSHRVRAAMNAALHEIEQAELARALAESELAYIFKHALVQETAYQSLLKNERRAFHRAAARALESGYPDALDENAARLAEHFWLAEEWQDAADYSQRAGTNALRVYAMREAMNHFERAQQALEKIPDASREQIIDALLGWAHAAQKFRPYAEQLAYLQRAEKLARELNDKPRLARALYGIGGVYTAQGHGLRAYEPLAECFLLANELGDERLTILPTYFMGMAALDTDPRAAIPLFQRAIALAQRYQDVDTQAVTWSALAWACARLGDFQNAKAAIARGQALLPQVQSLMVASDVDLFAGWAFLEMNETAQGVAYGQRSLGKARAADNYDCVCGAHLCLGFNQLTAQQLAPARQEFLAAIHESTFSGAAVLENMGRAGLAIARIRSGDSSALAELEETHTRSAALGDMIGEMLTAQALGEIFAARGELERAEFFLDAALAFYRRNTMLPALAQTLELAARVYEQQARSADAERARSEAAHLNKILREGNESHVEQ